MKLAVIIVNYRTAELTVRAARAAAAQIVDLPGSRVVVIDNDSNDGSLDRMAGELRPEIDAGRVEVLASGYNGGFGFANNLAIRHTLARGDSPDYVYLLNPDAEPHDGAIATLLAALDANPAAGIAGSGIQGSDGELHTSCFRFPSIAAEFESAVRLGVLSKLLANYLVALSPPAATSRVDWVSGASMLIRREVFEQIGFFDESFFLYYEEIDLCRRAQAAGWWTLYVPAATVTHLVSASTGVGCNKRRVPLYMLASRRHYFLKHHGASYLFAANAAWTAGFASWRMRRRIQRKPESDRPRELLDFACYNFNPRRPAGSGAPPRPRS